jgi:hypothetical protein
MAWPRGSKTAVSWIAHEGSSGMTTSIDVSLGGQTCVGVLMVTFAGSLGLGLGLGLEDALTSYDKDTKIDRKKIVEYAMLNTNFKMELPKCTKDTGMNYGQSIEGELKFRNLQ